MFQRWATTCFAASFSAWFSSHQTRNFSLAPGISHLLCAMNYMNSLRVPRLSCFPHKSSLCLVRPSTSHPSDHCHSTLHCFAPAFPPPRLRSSMDLEQLQSFFGLFQFHAPTCSFFPVLPNGFLCPRGASIPPVRLSTSFFLDFTINVSVCLWLLLVCALLLLSVCCLRFLSVFSVRPLRLRLFLFLLFFVMHPVSVLVPHCLSAAFPPHVALFSAKDVLHWVSPSSVACVIFVVTVFFHRL